MSHKRDCKRRVAELRDEILFQQPESRYDGDCPICCLPLPINKGKSMMMCCCSKMICNGCDYANTIREMKESLDLRCPFCRELIPSTQAEVDRHRMKRIEVNDPVAIRQMGNRRCRGEDFKSGSEYFSKAAELGDAEAHYHLSFMYRGGQCVEMDKKKELHHLEEAAILGHTVARYTLGCVESKNVKMNDPMNGCLSAVRAGKHWIIAAKLGDDESVGLLKWDFQMGLISKEDYATALRAHQDAVNATKSPQREAAEASRIYRKENFRSSSEI